MSIVDNFLREKNKEKGLKNLRITFMMETLGRI